MQKHPVVRTALKLVRKNYSSCSLLPATQQAVIIQSWFKIVCVSLKCAFWCPQFSECNGTKLNSLTAILHLEANMHAQTFLALPQVKFVIAHLHFQPKIKNLML